MYDYEMNHELRYMWRDVFFAILHRADGGNVEAAAIQADRAVEAYSAAFKVEDLPNDGYADRKEYPAPSRGLAYVPPGKRTLTAGVA